MRYVRRFFLAILLMQASSVLAGPLEDGRVAYQRQDYATALELWRPFADQGNVVVQANIGFMYQNGQGVTQDFAEAMRWYRRAATSGYGVAQYAIGFMYAYGQGVAKNYADAANWWRLASDHGNADAEYNLSLMYYKGEGITQNYAEALKWSRKAGERGYAAAQNNLGFMYRNGQGVGRDDAEAFKWYLLAADQGITDARYNVGLMYFDGLGVTQDYKEGICWIMLAARQGDGRARAALKSAYSAAPPAGASPGQNGEWLHPFTHTVDDFVEANPNLTPRDIQLLTAMGPSQSQLEGRRTSAQLASLTQQADGRIATVRTAQERAAIQIWLIQSMRRLLYPAS